MSHAPSTLPGSLQRRSRTFWVASWLLVVLYLVASGRAFIPGICATQRAMDAQYASNSDGPSMRALRSCCVLPPGESGESKESEAPVVPGDSGCALCKLVSSAAPLAATVYVPTPVEPAFASLLPAADQRTGIRVLGTFQTRAPPLSTHLA